MKQPDAETRFEPGNGPADGRARQREPLGRTRKSAGLHRFDKDRYAVEPVSHVVTMPSRVHERYVAALLPWCCRMVLVNGGLSMRNVELRLVPRYASKGGRALAAPAVLNHRKRHRGFSDQTRAEQPRCARGFLQPSPRVARSWHHAPDLPDASSRFRKRRNFLARPGRLGLLCTGLFSRISVGIEAGAAGLHKLAGA